MRHGEKEQRLRDIAFVVAGLSILTSAVCAFAGFAWVVAAAGGVANFGLVYLHSTSIASYAARDRLIAIEQRHGELSETLHRQLRSAGHAIIDANASREAQKLLADRHRASAVLLSDEVARLTMRIDANLPVDDES